MAVTLTFGKGAPAVAGWTIKYAELSVPITEAMKQQKLADIIAEVSRNAKVENGTLKFERIVVQTAIARKS